MNCKQKKVVAGVIHALPQPGRGCCRGWRTRLSPNLSSDDLRVAFENSIDWGAIAVRLEAGRHIPYQNSGRTCLVGIL